MTGPTKQILLTLILLLSSLCGQRLVTFPKFEVGGGVNLLMPRTDYENGWGYTLDGVWNFSPRYGANVAYASTQVEAVAGDTSRTISSLVGSLQLSFRRQGPVHGFTSLGLGSVSGEDNTLFVFGAGFKIPLLRKFLIRVEIRDYHSEIGVPFITFPRGRIALQGRTSKYFELGLGVAYAFGEKKKSGRRRPHPSWKD